jgi:2'-5' RNA ligase
MGQVVYIGVFLDEKSRTELLRLVMPRHANVFAEHVTVCFKPTEERLEQYRQGVAWANFASDAWPIIKFGDRVAFKAIGIAHDEKGQAVRVRGVPSSNENPHITISCAEGTKPMYSNQLLKEGMIEIFDEPIELVGILDTFPRSLNLVRGETNHG